MTVNTIELPANNILEVMTVSTALSIDLGAKCLG